MYLRYILFAVIIYLLYRFVFHFIIPIYKTTSQVKKQFREMHSKMEEQMNQASFGKATEDKQTDNPGKSTTKELGGDYIDFEEVK